VQLGAGYGVLVLGASFGATGFVPLIFLVMCYLLHTTGELCLSPVGLSAVTKLAPQKIVGMVMGAWFLSISAGHKIAGFVNELAGVKPEFKVALGVLDGLKEKTFEGAGERASAMAEMVAKECGSNAELQGKVDALLRLPESEITMQTLDVYLGIYNNLCWIAVGAGVLLLVASPVLKRWQHGVK
jgi:dipeptide/tripeptide permease